MSTVEGFAAVPNWMVRDESFDIYDIAVYAALASHTGPGGVRPSQATIASEARCSERKVRSTLQNLVDRGVVEVVRRRRKGSGVGRHGALTDGYVLHPHGRLADDEYATTDQPARHADASMTNRHATTDQPAQERKPYIYIEEEPVEEEPLEKKGVSFDEFWSIWPRKESKKNASTAWDRAVKRQQPGVILAAASAYVSHPARPEKQFVPHAATWLNGDRWNDPLPEVQGRGLSGVDVGRQADAILAGAIGEIS